MRRTRHPPQKQSHKEEWSQLRIQRRREHCLPQRARGCRPWKDTHYQGMHSSISNPTTAIKRVWITQWVTMYMSILTILTP